jgi:hypothetical protein
MNTQLSYLGAFTFMAFIIYEYIVPKVSSLFNKIYYDYHFIGDETEKQELNEKLDIQSYLRHKELERIMMEKMAKFEDKLIYYDLTLQRDNDLSKRNIFDLKDRVHTLEDQINTLIRKINNSVLVF